jgi:hypothetical protein
MLSVPFFFAAFLVSRFLVTGALISQSSSGLWAMALEWYFLFMFSSKMWISRLKHALEVRKA